VSQGYGHNDRFYKTHHFDEASKYNASVSLEECFETGDVVVPGWRRQGREDSNKYLKSVGTLD
jgi:hypothetical protein